MPRFPLLLLVGVLVTGPMPAFAQVQESAASSEREVVIADGDTLWSLARRHLGDPLRWPEWVEANRDLIGGPGDLEIGMRLQIPGAGPEPTGPGRVTEAAAESVPDSTSARVGVETLQPGDLRPAADPSAPVPVRRAPPAAPAERAPLRDSTPTAAPPAEVPLPPVGPGGGGPENEDSLDDPAGREPLRAIPFGLHASAPFLAAATAVERRAAGAPLIGPNRDTGLRSARRGDRLVLQGSGSGLTAGALLQAYRISGEEIADLPVAIPTGVLRVESVEPEAAVVVVEDSFDRMTPGDRVQRLPDAPTAPANAMVPASEPLPARILGGAVVDAMLAPGDWLFLDVGQTDGVRAGDEFVPDHGDDLFPPTGRIQVVLVQESTSTARVVGVGDRLLRVGTALRLDRRLR
ncbi:MAG: hypothetical protein HKO98_09340 [Gemmatimonadetes bacterium]|nr:hypothetical protein [Gemmatimonadota bacterium]